MPTYAYRCASCSHSFEQIQRMSEDALTECPACAGRINRVIYPVGVVFKGSGWYINDSRENQNGKKSEKESAASPEKTDGTAKDSGNESAAPKQESTPKKAEATPAAD